MQTFHSEQIQSVLKFSLKTNLKHHLQSGSKPPRNAFEFMFYRVSQNELEMASNPVLQGVSKRARNGFKPSFTGCLKTSTNVYRVSQNNLEMPLNQCLQGDSKRAGNALNSASVLAPLFQEKLQKQQV